MLLCCIKCANECQALRRVPGTQQVLVNVALVITAKGRPRFMEA